MQQKKSIKVFLASSNELEKDRNAFSSMIERKNKLWALTDRPYIDLQTWEICSESVSATRTQDEYNAIIKTIDIVVVLVWTKVGKYTSEEFQLAKKLFIQKGKPTVIVYQKKSDHTEESLIEYLGQFSETGKEYFHGQYDTFSELETKFLNEFDLYLNKNRVSKLTEKDKNRIELLEGLERRYEKRILSKMDSELNFQLDLILEYTKAGTSDQYVQDYFVNDYDTKSWEGFNELFYEFETKLKRLLILGEPGAGKTVLLLQFAKRLIEKAKINFDYPLPIILNLATWRNEYQDFKIWLEDNLVYAAGEYGTAKKYAKELVVENNMLLLLDGLDEIPEADRDSCLEKLWEYIKQNENTKANIADYPQLLICSRKNEYVQLPQNAPVKASLYISPLKADDLIKKLVLWKSDNSSAKVLFNRIKANPQIANELSTSFDVHLALHLANEYDFNDFSKENLLENFIQTELKKIKSTKPEKSRSYLGFLAIVLSETKKGITFELIDIQPDWTIPVWSNYVLKERYNSSGKIDYNIPKSYKRILEVFRILYISIFSCMVIIILFILEGRSSTLVSFFQGIAAGVIFSLIFGLILSIANISKTNIILIVESKKFSLKSFRFATFSSVFKIQFLKIFIGTIPFILLFGLIIAYDKIEYKSFNFTFYEGIKESFIEGLSGIILQWFTLHVFPTDKAKEIYYGVIICISVIVTIIDRKNILNKNYDSIEPQYKIIKKIYYLVSAVFMVLAACWALQAVVLGFGYGLYYHSPYALFFQPFIKVLIYGAIFGIVLGVISGVFNGSLESLFIIKRSPNIYRPYKRLLASFIFDFIKLSLPVTTLILAFVSTIKVNQHFYILTNIIVIVQIFCLFISIYNSPLIKHLTVRLVLFFQRKTPLRYRTFLNKVSQTGLMEKDGGQWRFRHQLIQDWFAGQDSK